MVDEWLWKNLDFPSTETILESIKGSPHLLKKSMDTKFYVHTFVMQYFDTNIVFSVIYIYIYIYIKLKIQNLPGSIYLKYIND